MTHYTSSFLCSIPHIQARRKGLASLQPRLQLWLGRMGAAAGQLLAAPLQYQSGGGRGGDPDESGGGSGGVVGDGGLPWDAERRVSLEVPFMGFEDLAARPKVGVTHPRHPP